MRIPYRQLTQFMFLCSVLMATEAAAQVFSESRQSSIPDSNKMSLPAHEELARLTISMNPDLLAARQRLEEARGLLRQAGARPNPSIDISSNSGDATGSTGEREFSVEYSHTFELGGKRERRIVLAKISSDLAGAEIADMERRLISDVRIQYAEYLSAMEKLKNAENFLQLMRRDLDLVKIRTDAGEAAPMEQGLLRVELNRIDSERMLLAGQAEQALLRVKLLAGLPLEENLPPLDGTLARRPVLNDIRQYSADALSRRPDLVAARIREQVADAELELTRSAGTTDLTVRGGYTHSQSRFDQFGFASPGGAVVPLRAKDNILALGISIALPLLDRNQGNLEAALARRSAARLARESLERTVHQEVLSAFNKVNAARQSLRIFETGVMEQSKENLRIVREAYELGELWLIDVIGEQRRLVEIERTHIDLMRDAYMADIELERDCASGGINFHD